MSSSPTKLQFQTVLGHGHCAQNTVQLTESITAELSFEGSQKMSNCFDGLTVEGDLDNEGSDYASLSSSQSDTLLDSDDESDVIKIMNKEFQNIKTSAGGRVLATTLTTIQENLIDTEDTVPIQSFVPTVKATKWNPIYYFYDIVHLNGFIGYLKTHFPPMYWLYLILKSCGTSLTEDKLKMTQGEKILNLDTAAAYLTQLEQASANLVDAFNKQVNKAFGNWNQEKFEDLLAKWLVACDQPFEEVEKPEFKAFVEYTH
ncbi:hypothetical protein CY34DRAFT_18001 [Suillus luteus UH-Slu-Lm8-n1]|uniref:Uncharacterized protein n=1 Tax=Suillus luteus UH-Slu-Lm8-n1 TaxID=930992 RepID=A0A0C9Z977_9AGAM|nr:hypothetical protein CY34DRAFT_18001 [Suillus luteus UH-Slu-Lm8-n1]